MTDGPYLFDVGPVALAHAETPVSEPALRYVRRAIAGEIDAVVPHPVLFGAHHTLTNVYGLSNEMASRSLARFRDARRIHWHEGFGEELAVEGLELAGASNVDGWDGYYAAVARDEGVETILTLDDDFERIDGVACDVLLDREQFEALDEYVRLL